MPSDDPIYALQRAIAPAQMTSQTHLFSLEHQGPHVSYPRSTPSIGPTHVLAGSTSGSPSTAPGYGSTGIVPNLGNVPSYGTYGWPAANSSPPYDPLDPPLMWLTDNSNIYWWGEGAEYATNAQGSSGYFTQLDPYTTFGHPIAPTGGPIDAHLRDRVAPYAYPVEGQLFAQDPAILAHYIATEMPTKSKDIAAVVGGTYTDSDNNCSGLFGTTDLQVPSALALIAPASEPWHMHPDLQGTIAHNLANATFFDPPPEDWRYVAAAKLQAAGICSKEIQLAPLLNGTNTTPGLFSILQSAMQNVCSKPALSNGGGVALNYVFGAPLIGRDDNSVPVPQLFLNADLSMQLKVGGLIGFGCNLRASTLYDILIDDTGKLVFHMSEDLSGHGNPRIDSYNAGGCEDWS